MVDRAPDPAPDPAVPAALLKPEVEKTIQKMALRLTAAIVQADVGAMASPQDAQRALYQLCGQAIAQATGYGYRLHDQPRIIRPGDA